MTAPTRPPKDLESPAARRARLAWCLYDFGNSGFAVVFPVAFAVFFAKTIVGGDDGSGDALWGILQSTSMALVALSAPFLGGVADHAGARGRLLAVTTALGVCVVLAFHFLGPGMVLVAFVLGALANVAFEGSNVFYNAYLPDLAPTSHQGRLSARAFGLGYFGSLVALGAVAGLTQLGAGAHVWTWVALQWAFGGFMAYRWLPRDRPTGTGLWRAGADGFKRTGATLREVWRAVRLRRFLIAYFIYMDGVHTVIVFAALYAEGTLGYASGELFGLIALVQLTALIGALALAGPIDRVGPQRVVLGLLVWWLGVVVGAYLAPDKVTFAVVAGFAGLGLGSIQAASRAFMARLIPSGKEAEYFGFYALCGKTGAILGPLVFAAVTWALAGDRRPAVLSVAAFFLVGGWLLRRVSDEPVEASTP